MRIERFIFAGIFTLFSLMLTAGILQTVFHEKRTSIVLMLAVIALWISSYFLIKLSAIELIYARGGSKAAKAYSLPSGSDIGFISPISGSGRSLLVITSPPSNRLGNPLNIAISVQPLKGISNVAGTYIGEWSRLKKTSYEICIPTKGHWAVRLMVTRMHGVSGEINFVVGIRGSASGLHIPNEISGIGSIIEK